jgi:hypothetical protein
MDGGDLSFITASIFAPELGAQSEPLGQEWLSLLAGSMVTEML